MLKFLSLQPEIFAISINDLSLEIAKIEKRKNGFHLVSSGEAEIKEGVIKEGVIQDELTLSKIIKSACGAVRGKKIGTKYIIASLPEEKSFLRIIQMPKMTRKELESAIFFQVENYIPLTIDKVYLDFSVINSHDGKNEPNHLDILINAMPKSIVDSYVSCFKKADLMPCVLEVESQAIVRALKKNEENIPPTIFIDFGQMKTSFIVFSSNSVRFSLSIPVSSRHITKAISDGLSIDLDRAEKLKIKNGIIEKIDGENNNIMLFAGPIMRDLAGHVIKCMDFYHERASREHFLPDGKIEKIILCGGGANLKGLTEFLSRELKIKVDLGNPFTNIVLKEKKKNQLISREKELSFAAAIGLAIRGANDVDL